jgi:radical SAM protein with 4Fe4S-binding SPASM domain
MQKTTRHKFHKIYIELTNICGLECSFCPTKEIIKPQIMSLEEFEEIIVQVQPFTKLIALHIFGDPLTLKNLESYLNIASKYKISVEITTTGIFLNNHPQELFLHPAIRQINFSLNSFDKNEMKCTLDQYLQPLFDLCDLKLQKKIHNFINFRLWNLDEQKSDEEFNIKVLKKLYQKFHSNLENIDTYKPTRLENQILLHFDNYFEWPSLHSSHFSHGFCHGLTSQMGILSDGTVVPCCLDGFGVINLGNIFTDTLVDILESKRAKDIIEGFQHKKAIEELCQKCSFKDRFL